MGAILGYDPFATFGGGDRNGDDDQERQEGDDDQDADNDGCCDKDQVCVAIAVDVDGCDCCAVHAARSEWSVDRCCT